MSKIQKYHQIFCLGARHAIKNFKGLLGLCIFLVTCLTIFAHLWQIAAAKTGAVNLEPKQLLWFIAFNEWVLVAMPDVQLDMEQDLRTGRLAYLLPRPVSYLGTIFFEAAGILCVNLLILGIVGFIFTWIRCDGFPFGLPYFLLSMFFGLLAGCVGLLFQMLIGISAFWIHEVAPFNWVWEKLLFMLGGLVLPLSVYPEWIQAIAYLTPFPSILGGRSSLVMDVSLHNVVWIFTSLIFWGLFGALTLSILYRRGLSILNIEGG